MVRRHTFELDHTQTWIFGRDGLAFACAHLDCIDETISRDACPVDCRGWTLPLAIEFERVEAYSAALCR